MKVEIWHNPRCSKSRQTLALLEERGIDPTIVRYLEAPPSRQRLQEVLEMLEMTPSELARRKEEAWKDRGLTNANEDEVLDAMVEIPKLIERPVVITDRGAALGRPPESVLVLLED